MAGTCTFLPAIGSISLGISCGSPNLPRHMAKAHLTQHIIEPHPAQHTVELHGGRTPPASPLVATTGTSPHHTAVAPSTAILVALPFAGDQVLTKGTSTTCLQEPLRPQLPPSQLGFTPAMQRRPCGPNPQHQQPLVTSTEVISQKRAQCSKVPGNISPIQFQRPP